MTSQKSRTVEFWQDKSFWKDKNPLPIDEFTDARLQMYPTPGQMEILYALAGKTATEWSTEYSQYILAIGQGGGKNRYIIAPFVAYLTYKLCNMRDPHLYLSRFRNEPLDRMMDIDITNSSMVTAKQAGEVHFNNMKNMLIRCSLDDGTNWFEKYTGMDMRTTLGDIQGKSIFVPTVPGNGRIRLYSLDSKHSSLEGLNILVFIADELSRADTKASMADAKELWKVGTGNVSSRFGGGVGKSIVFSYLNNSEYDLTSELYEAAQREKELLGKTSIYSVLKSSFSLNPNINMNDEDVQRAYRDDPQAARARYECIKGFSREGFYQPHVETVKDVFYPGMETPLTYRQTMTTRIVKHPQTGAPISKTFRAVEITGVRGDSRPRCWFFDAAEKYDAFVLKGGYVETMDVLKDELFIATDGKTEAISINKRPIIDIVILWQPGGDDCPVDYLNVGEVIGRMLQEFPNSRSANSDKYNSEKLSQEIQRRGVSSATYAFSQSQQYKIYMKARWLIWSHIPMIYRDDVNWAMKKGMNRTIGEWNVKEHEQLIRDGNKIDHPPNGSKDLADCDAFLMNDLLELESVGRIIVDGAYAMTDDKIAAIAERYLIERQRLINQQIKPDKHDDAISMTMGMSLAELAILKEWVQTVWPELWEIRSH